VGQEFVRNTNSAFYQEDSGYGSGFVGYVKPTTRIIFGSYEFIESCAADGASPIETDYHDFTDFNAMQMQGYVRAALAFFEDYMQKTGGRSHPHSYALARMFDSMESALRTVYDLDGVKDFHTLPSYGRFVAVVDFIDKALALVAKHGEKPETFRVSDPLNADIYDGLANLVFEAILAASYVASPSWTAWSVQHNAVWAKVFGLNNDWVHKIVGLKVRRLLYSEIKEMDKFANFKGARIIGYCLNVLGLSLVDRHKGFRKESYPLQAIVLRWIKANFHNLLANHPKVAATCIQGSIEYDAVRDRLSKTFSDETGKEPHREYLDLD
jgi:hypothetical protein